MYDLEMSISKMLQQTILAKVKRFHQQKDMTFNWK